MRTISQATTAPWNTYPLLQDNTGNCSTAIQVTIIVPTNDGLMDTPEELYCCTSNQVPYTTPNASLTAYANYAAAPNAPSYINFDARAGYVVANFPATPTTVNWNGAGNPFGTTNVYVDKDIVVPDNVTLTINNMNIYFTPNARILVLRGGRLRLGNSSAVQLSGTCTAQWQGIQVVGPGGSTSCNVSPRDATLRNFGIVDADNVRIRNAFIGIAGGYLPIMGAGSPQQLATPAYQTPEFPTFPAVNWFELFAVNGNALYRLPGGVVRTNNGCRFTDCFEGINLSFYNNNALVNGTFAKSSIQQSMFESPNGLLYPFNSGGQTLRSEAGVAMNFYANLDIGNNDASLPPNNFSQQKYGIRGNLAGNINVRRNNITNCDVAISLHNSATATCLPFGSANIRSNTLNNNRIGIQAYGANVEMVNNLIDGNFTNPSSPRVGLFLGDCQFALSNTNGQNNGNTIVNQLVGAFVTKNESSINHIRNNKFTNCFLGIWTFGANGSANDNDPTGVNIRCNEFDQYAMALNTAQAQNPLYGTANRLNDQGYCDSEIQQPADNTFFQLASLDGVLPDINSSLPASVTYTYYHRPGNAFIPQKSGAINVVQCANSGSVDCEYPLLALAAIQQIGDTDTKNRAAIDKMYYYLHDENDSLRNTSAVAQLWSGVNTDAAKRLLLEYDLQQGDYAAWQQRLDQLPNNTLNQQYFKQLHQLSRQLNADQRGILDLTNDEYELLHTIAASETPTALDAQALLFVSRGEEYPLNLPALPDFCSADMIDAFAHFVVSFKTESNSPPTAYASKAYPNPAQQLLYLDYNTYTPEAPPIVLSLYHTATAQLLEQRSLSGQGTLVLDIGHLPAGIYYYTISQAATVLQRQQLLINP